MRWYRGTGVAHQPCGPGSSNISIARLWLGVPVEDHLRACQGRAQVGRLQYGVDVSNVLSPRPAKAAPAKLDEDSPLPKK